MTAVVSAVAGQALGAASKAGDRLADTKAKRWVLVGVIGTGVLTTIATVNRDDELPGPRLLAGVAVAGVLLTVLAEGAPKIAGGLALTMFLTAALSVGGDAWEGVSTMTRPTPTTT